jgi:hypothetical protein
MAGWVYIITNKSMPNMLKVGFTEREPSRRARDLDGTGLPTPYVVKFAIEVSEPRTVEREAHNRLKPHHVGKEWFRCSIDDARNAIIAACGSSYYESWDAHSTVTCNSPLVPGHALSPYFSASIKRSVEKKSPVVKQKANKTNDGSPLPPGHPSRGLL